MKNLITSIFLIKQKKIKVNYLKKESLVNKTNLVHYRRDLDAIG